LGSLRFWFWLLSLPNSVVIHPLNIVTEQAVGFKNFQTPAQKVTDSSHTPLFENSFCPDFNVSSIPANKLLDGS
jgi:hypothetical protein